MIILQAVNVMKVGNFFLSIDFILTKKGNSEKQVYNKTAKIELLNRNK